MTARPVTQVLATIVYKELQGRPARVTAVRADAYVIRNEKTDLKNGPTAAES